MPERKKQVNIVLDPPLVPVWQQTIVSHGERGQSMAAQAALLVWRSLPVQVRRGYVDAYKQASAVGRVEDLVKAVKRGEFETIAAHASSGFSAKRRPAKSRA